MTSKEAILKTRFGDYYHEIAQRVCHCDACDALEIVLSLAERMAMYEWWWGIKYEAEAEKYGLEDLFGKSIIPEICMERVMKAWKENT